MSSASAPGVVERVQNFVSENKKVVLVGAAVAVVAIGGAAYYASTSDDASRRKKKGRSSKKSKSEKTSGKPADDGPLLEEIEEAARAYSDEEIQRMSEEERSRQAESLKKEGNTAYTLGNYHKALDLYTKAIKMSPKPQPTFHSNRAACYMNMKPPQYEQVVADCDIALSFDSKYQKALNRRAVALEKLGRYEEALRDYTALTIFEGFQKEATTSSVERVLKVLSETRAKEIMEKREPKLPSQTFTNSYFSSFRPRAIPELPEDATDGDRTLVLALEALEARDFIHAGTLASEAVEQGPSTDALKAEAYNLRGTFRFLCGEVEGAKSDLEQSIALVPSLTQSWVKLASVFMERGEPEKTFDCFEQAIKHNPNDPDIYYHRGQVHFIMNQFAQASEDYIKSSELDPNFVFSHIQLAVAYYKSGNLAKSMATFRSTLTKFPQRSEPHNYYGELLLDQNRMTDAIEKFERAIELENAKAPPTNVIALVNKGLAVYQHEHNIQAAENCCKEALRIDPDSEAATATLAQLYLQQSKIEDAVALFNRQVDIARSVPELTNALTYKYASEAQLAFQKDHPDMVEIMRNTQMPM